MGVLFVLKITERIVKVMVKITIDAGHGGHDPGAIGLGLREKDLTLTIALKTRDILQKEYPNVSVKMTRTTDVYLTLAQRARIANVWGADLLLSIHINATPSGFGYEDFIYVNASHKAIDVQNAVNKEVVKATGWRNRGKKRKNLQVLRDSKMAAILTESGFIDNPDDSKLLKDDAFLDKVARGHVNGLAIAFNLKKEEVIVPNKPKDRPVSASHKDAWDWAVKKGFLNGERPGEPLTREQFATTLKRVHDNMKDK